MSQCEKVRYFVDFFYFGLVDSVSGVQFSSGQVTVSHTHFRSVTVSHRHFPSGLASQIQGLTRADEKG